MNLNIRRVLLSLALTAFAVTTPVLLLYALGYRPAARLGVIVLESIPNRARVSVNEQEVGSTPHTVSNFGGQKVHIKIQKDGYRVWEKQLFVKAGATSAITSTRLIPEKPTSRVLVSDISQFSLAPNRILLAAVDNQNRLTVYDESGRLIVPAISLVGAPRGLLWSPDSSLMLISYSNNRHEIISLQRAQRQNVPALTSILPETIAWDPRLPGRLLALDAESILFAYDTVSAIPSRLAANVTAFALTSREIMLVTNNALQTLSLSGELSSHPPIPLEKPVARLIASPNGEGVVIFSDTSAALVVENKLVPLVDSVSLVGFAPSGQLLYLQTAPNELAVVNISDTRLRHVPLQRFQLVTRTSQLISHPQWFAGGEHLVYQIGDQIVLTEIDTRDHAVSEIIDSTNLSDAQVFVGADGETLFYLKKEGDSVDLVRTELVIP